MKLLKVVNYCLRLRRKIVVRSDEGEENYYEKDGEGFPVRFESLVLWMCSDVENFANFLSGFVVFLDICQISV
jgi:hypothetical protein